MYSKTKHAQSEDVLRRMAVFALGLNQQEAESTKVRELTGGYFNRPMSDHLRMTRQVIVKIAPCTDRLLTYEKNIMQAEVEAMRLTEEKTAVPVPHIYCYDNTHHLCNSDYFFMEKLEGLPYSRVYGVDDGYRQRSDRGKPGPLQCSDKWIEGPKLRVSGKDKGAKKQLERGVCSSFRRCAGRRHACIRGSGSRL